MSKWLIHIDSDGSLLAILIQMVAFSLQWILQFDQEYLLNLHGCVHSAHNNDAFLRPAFSSNPKTPGEMDRVVYPQAHICGEEWDC